MNLQKYSVSVGYGPMFAPGGSSSGPLVASWHHLEPSSGHLGPFRNALRPSWRHKGGSLRPSRRHLGHLGPIASFSLTRRLLFFPSHRPPHAALPPDAGSSLEKGRRGRAVKSQSTHLNVSRVHLFDSHSRTFYASSYMLWPRLCRIATQMRQNWHILVAIAIC